MMTALIGSMTKDLESYMDQKALDSFSEAIDGVYSELAGRCLRWNCLNATTTPPSKRHPQCVLGSPAPVANCPVGKPFNNQALITCTFTDTSGGRWNGVCDPNGHWYAG